MKISFGIAELETSGMRDQFVSDCVPLLQVLSFQQVVNTLNEKSKFCLQKMKYPLNFFRIIVIIDFYFFKIGSNKLITAEKLINPVHQKAKIEWFLKPKITDLL